MKQVYEITVPEETRGWGEKKRTLPAFTQRVQVFIDIERIVMELGVRAARSKSGRSVGLSGLVQVKRVK